MADYIIFGGVDTRTYGAYVYATESIHEAAKREFKAIQVPGRNGDLILDGNRWANVKIEYQVAVPASFASQARALRNALLAVKGYAKLQDSFSAGEYRSAIFSGGFEVDRVDRDGAMGTFRLKFEAKPQRFLDSGDTATTFTASGTLVNDTLMEALPKIVVAAPSGENISGTFSVNGTAVTITDAPTNVLTVDSDLLSVYNGTDNLNAYASSDFPVLKAGNNSVVLGAEIGNIVSIQIYPRWWVL